MKIKYMLLTGIAMTSLTSHAVDGDSLKNAGILCLSGGTLLLSACEFGKAFNINQSLRDMKSNSANYPIVLGMYQDDINNRSDRALKARNRALVTGSMLLALGVYGLSKYR